MNKVAWFIIVFPVALNAQVEFGFEQGGLEEWIQVPAARWEVSSEIPITGDHSLHHAFDHPDGSTDMIFLKIDEPSLEETLTYSFRVRHGYPPSRSNHWQFLVHAEYSDSGELLEGMVLGVNFRGSDDMLKLWQYKGGVANEIISTNLDYQEGIGTVAAPLFMLKRIPGGRWKISLSLNGQAGAMAEIGSGMEDFPVSGRNIGFRYSYSSSQDRKLWVDDIMVLGSFTRDSIAPVVQEISPVFQDTLLVRFSEPVTISDGFHCDWNNKQPGSFVLSGDLLKVSFPGTFPNRTDQEVRIGGLKDREGNRMKDTSLLFMLNLPEFGDVVINEVMPDPFPQVYLPECEYIELFNRSEWDFRLGSWIIAVNDREYRLPDVCCPAGGYVILIPEEDACRYGSSRVLPCLGGSSAVPNAGGNLMLKDADGRLVHWLEYPGSDRGDPLKSEGGWSLERTDPDRFCGGVSYWCYSGDPSGGTPGFRNSCDAELEDRESPRLQYFGFPDSSTIRLHFSEAIFAGPDDPLPFIELDGRRIHADMASLPHVRNWLDFILPASFGESGSATCLFGGIRDCVGNIGGITSFTVGMPLLPEKEYVILNEVMFDPLPGGAEFIELFNASNTYIDLADLRIRVQSDPAEIAPSVPVCKESCVLPPGAYIALSGNIASLKEMHLPDHGTRMAEMEQWRALRNDGGIIFLLNRSDQPLDRMSYNVSMHHAGLKECSGISLERISSHLSASDPSNWASASITSGYATPGAINSQHLVMEHSEDVVDLTPRIFSPDMDGHEDILAIRIRTGRDNPVLTIIVTDLNGYSLRELMVNGLAGPDEVVCWDGCNDAGNPLPAGIYVIHVRIFSGSGEKVFRKAVGIRYR